MFRWRSWSVTCTWYSRIRWRWRSSRRTPRCCWIWCTALPRAIRTPPTSGLPGFRTWLANTLRYISAYRDASFMCVVCNSGTPCYICDRIPARLIASYIICTSRSKLRMRIFHYDFISYRIDALLRCVCTVQCRFNTSCRMRTTLKRLSVTYTALDLLLSIWIWLRRNTIYQLAVLVFRSVQLYFLLFGFCFIFCWVLRQ